MRGVGAGLSAARAQARRDDSRSRIPNIDQGRAGDEESERYCYNREQLERVDFRDESKLPRVRRTEQIGSKVERFHISDRWLLQTDEVERSFCQKDLPPAISRAAIRLPASTMCYRRANRALPPAFRAVIEVLKAKARQR